MKSFSIILQITTALLSLVICFCIATGSFAATYGMKSESSGAGSMDHTVTVESLGQFRLAFEAAYNYGMSQWFDLVNDPNAKTNIAREGDGHNPAASQRALFNQAVYPDHVIAHIISAAQNPDLPRSLTVVETNPVRTIVVCRYHPLLFHKVVRDLQFATTYVIYSSGKIFIKNTLESLADRELKEWRNSMIGLGDPTYLTMTDSGSAPSATTNMLSDPSKAWDRNQWGGYRLNQSGNNAWEILSNTANTLEIGKRISGNLPLTNGPYSIISRHEKYGWIRSSNLQDPHVWTRDVAKYLFIYWDPTTPAPYTSLRKTSIMLVPHPDNPYKGEQFHHEWLGYKRFYYHGDKIPMTKGQKITQRFMMQLGTKGSTLLPEINSRKVADPYADDYVSPNRISVQKGSVVNEGFDLDEGCYALSAERNHLLFEINGTKIRRIKSVFKIHNFYSGFPPLVYVNGVLKKPGEDFIYHQFQRNSLLVQFLFDIDSKVKVEVVSSEAKTKDRCLGTDSTITEVPNPEVKSDDSNISFGSPAFPVKPAVGNSSVGAKAKVEVRRSPVKPEEKKTSIDSKTKVNLPPETIQKSIASDVKNGPKGMETLRKFAILSYSKYSPEVASWIDEKFQYKIQGAKPLTPGRPWMCYIDIYGLGSFADYFELKEFANSYKTAYEDMLLHAGRNYTAKLPVAFKEMDKFDVFEGKNGVLRTSDDRTFEDVTSKAYRGKVRLSDTVYVGYEEPFAEIHLEFSQAGRNVKYYFEFWNGSHWQMLSVNDSTAGFTSNGTMSFIPPQSWLPLSINNSRKKYFVRMVVADADVLPVTNRIFGDDWLDGAGNACRGWDPVGTHVLNSGSLAFNPQPPAHASAKFRYQARIAFWGIHHFVANPADPAWARFVAEKVLRNVERSGYTGVMCDDGERNVVSDGISPDQTDFVAQAKAGWESENTRKYESIVDDIKKANAKIQVGVNAQRKRLVQKGDWNLAEYHTSVWQTGSHRLIAVADSSTVMTYDDYLPENNPKGIKGVLIYQDTADLVPGRNALWDRANRGPIAALSKHYIGMNPNTIFSYYSRGGFMYSETDEVVLKDGKVLHQSLDRIPIVENVKRWATYFPAMGVDIGVPDQVGYNEGFRDFLWKKGTEIGGGPDIWRRDFTNSVVLHRPAFWNTSKDAYETYSNSIQLDRALYPLKADGTTGPSQTSIALRAGEGAILMKHPIETPGQ